MSGKLPEFIENNLFSNHFLRERIQDMEQWGKDVNVEEAFEETRKLLKQNKDVLEHGGGESETQRKFIDKVLEKVLNHYFVTEKVKDFSGKRLKPDYLFLEDPNLESDIVKSDDKDYFTESFIVGDAKDWKDSLDRGGTDHRNPSFQIYNYVDRTRIKWGILTNGEKWRLYCYEDCSADTYYEVNLLDILNKPKDEALKDFKYFYLFFRKESFMPEANGFVDRVFEGSIKYSEELEEDLEHKVYKSLEIAVKGFFETNDIEKTEENIDLVHRASLIFLYRLLFILNAESRDLLPTEDEKYKQAFGLTKLKEMLLEDSPEENPIFQRTTVAWDIRISRLFEGINEGYPLHGSEIPAYNGGLFNPENGDDNKFLTENKLQGNYLKDILKLLATNYDEKKEKRVLLDYKDLNIRHLGSVYEGLLEYDFKLAKKRKVLENGKWADFSDSSKEWGDLDEDKRVDEGELYLTGDSGERRATGSYYTPEYIVEYIVENTVGPKIKEKLREAKDNGEDVLSKILELNICDPAMGSGHFLTEATELIAEKIIEHANLEGKDIDDENEFVWTKRQVVQNCIYGVDVNPLATELAKLSLWIETMSKGRPLSFLDYHLKTGNSLIGSNIYELSKHPETKKEKEKKKKGQLTLGDTEIYSSDYDIEKNIKKLLKMYENIKEISEDSVKDIHKKEEIYQKFRDNKFRRRFKGLADVYTSYYFDNEFTKEQYEELLEAFSAGGDKWNEMRKEKWVRKATDAVKNSQEINKAEKRHFFHWKLEFPEIFFDIETGKEKDNPGFDAVIGNPPYIDSEHMVESMPVEREYIADKYIYADGNWDIYCVFIELAINRLRKDGKMGYIIPNKLLAAEYANKSRERLSDLQVSQIYDFSRIDVFDVDIYPIVMIVSSSTLDKDLEVIRMKKESGKIKEKFNHYVSCSDLEEIDGSSWTPLLSDSFETFKKIAGLRPREVKVDVSGGATVSEAYEIKEALLDLEENETNEKGFKLVNTGIIESWYAQWGIKYTTYIKDQYLKPFVTKKSLSRISETRVNQAESEKIVLAGMGKQLKCLVDEGEILAAKSTSLVTSDEYQLYNLAALLNSKVPSFVLKSLYQDLGLSGGYIAIGPPQLRKILSRTVDEKLKELDSNKMTEKGNKIKEKSIERDKLNLSLQDYLGSYDFEDNLGSFYLPVSGAADTILTDTKADRDNLKLGRVDFEEENGELILKASARYKPEDKEEFDNLDSHGYTETELIPAMKFSGSEEELALIREFTKLAVDEAGGFANFRQNATKTNSLIDRLEELILPKLEDVESGLEKYLEQEKKAERLEEEIQETDDLIDAIVFDLYDLGEEEVITVLDSLDTEEKIKENILEKFRELKG